MTATRLRGVPVGTNLDEVSESQTPAKAKPEKAKKKPTIRQPEHLVTGAAKKGRCPRCWAPVLAGYAEGLAVAVDVDPLSPAAEDAAHRAGRQTYVAWRTEGHFELWHRSEWRRSPTTKPVLAEHPHAEAHTRAQDAGAPANPAQRYRVKRTAPPRKDPRDPVPQSER